MIAVGAAAGFAAGLTGGLIYRYRTVDKGKKPLPITAQRQPGTDTSALEVDKATNIITVRTVAAQKLFDIFKGYALEPLGDSGQGEQARFSLVKKDPNAPESASAASWLITAANAGFDVLIDERVTGVLAGGGSPDPGGVWLSSVVITRPADTVKFATYPAMKYAVLFNGNPKGSGAFPAPPAYATLPPSAALSAPSSPSEDIAKSVTSGVAEDLATHKAQLYAGVALTALLGGGAVVTKNPTVRKALIGGAAASAAMGAYGNYKINHPATATGAADASKDAVAYSLIPAGGLLAVAALAMRQYKRDGAKMGWGRLDPTTDAALLGTGVVGGGAFLYGLGYALKNPPTPASPGLTISTTKGVGDKITSEQRQALGAGLAAAAIGGGIAALVKQRREDVKWGSR